MLFLVSPSLPQVLNPQPRRLEEAEGTLRIYFGHLEGVLEVGVDRGDLTWRA